ncbi:MAG: metallophosphoesterase [Clostridia bacterium]|nr:metallophosphoesterase [Clostridia bacterium]
MNEYRGKHASSAPWAISSTASVPARRARHLQRNNRRRIRIIFLLVLLLCMLLYPFAEARILVTETTSLRSDDLPSDADQLRIVYLSDIHWGFWFNDGDLSRLITRINSLRPDLVLFGGDYATDHENALLFFRRLQSMPKIHARYGIFGVPGEADCGSGDQDRILLSEAMTNAGVMPLMNQVAYVKIGSGRICIAGLDDVSGGKPDLNALVTSVSADDFVIFLAHNPSVIPEAQLLRDASGSLGWFDLGLFGHTHGGQMMFFSSLLEIAEDVPDRYLSGWFTENRVNLLVSRGVGTSVFPARLFCPPQIHLIEVTAY